MLPAAQRHPPEQGAAGLSWLPREEAKPSKAPADPMQPLGPVLCQGTQLGTVTIPTHPQWLSYRVPILLPQDVSQTQGDCPWFQFLLKLHDASCSDLTRILLLWHHRCLSSLFLYGVRRPSPALLGHCRDRPEGLAGSVAAWEPSQDTANLIFCTHSWMQL